MKYAKIINGKVDNFSLVAAVGYIEVPDNTEHLAILNEDGSFTNPTPPEPTEDEISQLNKEEYEKYCVEEIESYTHIETSHVYSLIEKDLKVIKEKMTVDGDILWKDSGAVFMTNKIELALANKNAESKKQSKWEEIFGVSL